MAIYVGNRNNKAKRMYWGPDQVRFAYLGGTQVFCVENQQLGSCEVNGISTYAAYAYDSISPKVDTHIYRKMVIDVSLSTYGTTGYSGFSCKVTAGETTILESRKRLQAGSSYDYKYEVLMPEDFDPNLYRENSEKLQILIMAEDDRSCKVTANCYFAAQ